MYTAGLRGLRREFEQDFHVYEWERITIKECLGLLIINNMNEALNGVCEFAEVIEKTFVVIYKSLRYSSPFGVLVFYFYVLLAIYTVRRFFKQPETIYCNVVDESEVTSVIKTVQDGNNKIIENVNNLLASKETERKADYSKRLRSAANELKVIEDMYSEFKEEISDSHKSISESLKLPSMK